MMFIEKYKALFDENNEESNTKMKKFNLDVRVYCNQFIVLKGNILFEMENYKGLVEFIAGCKKSFLFDEYLEWFYVIFGRFESGEGLKESNYEALRIFVEYNEYMSELKNFRANWEMVEKFIIKAFELNKVGIFEQDFAIFEEEFEGENAIMHYLSTVNKETIEEGNHKNIVKN